MDDKKTSKKHRKIFPLTSNDRGLISMCISKIDDKKTQRKKKETRERFKERRQREEQRKRRRKSGKETTRK